MSMWIGRLATGAIASAGFLGLFGGKADAPKGAAQVPAKAPRPPAAHTVTREPFRVTLTLKGVFVASTAAEILLDPQSWTDLRLAAVVPHGTRVKKGDTAMELERTGIERAIRDMEAGQELSDLAFERLQAEVSHLEKTVPLDLEGARRAKRIGDEDLARYEKVDREQTLKSSEFTVKSSRDYLEYAQEELRQLEKMYAADDLTEETEEIILKRARNNLERSAFNVEKAEVKHEYTVEYQIPRQDEEKKEAAVRKALDLVKAEGAVPALLTRKTLELAKMKHDRLRSSERLAELRADREAMVLRSPLDGIVYYGRSVDGVWQKPDPIETALAQGMKLKARTVWLTVVQPRPLHVYAAVSETQRRDIREGLDGRAVPAADPNARLAVKVEQVADVPDPDGTFPVHAQVDLGDDALGLMPGMTCEVRLVPYVKADSIAVPAKAVHADEEDDSAYHVYIRTAGGRSEERSVTIGRSHAGEIEIISGLRLGEKVLLEAPAK